MVGPAAGEGHPVLVIDTRGARTVVVEPWPGLDC